MATLDIRNMTRRKAPVFAFEKARKAVLPTWDISLVFAGATRAQSLNKRLRRKSYVPNVLSYPVSDRAGEVIICLEVAQKQAPDYDMNYQEFVGYLFIHALLHLKGMPHGSTMEKAERQIQSRLAPTHSHATTNRNRNRHRDVPSKGRRRRRS